MQTEFPGVGTTNNFDLQTQGLNEAGWTAYSFTFDNVSGNGIFRIQAAGAFVGAGGIVLLDNAIAGARWRRQRWRLSRWIWHAPRSLDDQRNHRNCRSVRDMLTDVDGDGVLRSRSKAGEIEYKYAVNAFTDQEQLVDDMVAGDCAPVTGEFNPSWVTTNDVFGSARLGGGGRGWMHHTSSSIRTRRSTVRVTLVVYGCEAATNYNPLANVDNLTCEFDGTGNNCPSDLNGDGSVTTADLLVFLVSFGDLCE